MEPGFLVAVSKHGKWSTVRGAYSVMQKHHSVRHGEWAPWRWGGEELRANSLRT